LLNKTIGLISLGAVGKQVAKHLRGFVATVIYYDPVRPSAELERSLGVSYTEFDDLVRRSDIVSLHLPLLPETAGIINVERILAMKKGTVLIAGRGGRGSCFGRGSEGRASFRRGHRTFASEPPIGSELLALENTVVTPHLAGATLDNFAGIVARAVENAKAVLRGEPLAKTDEVLAVGKVAAV
jgi:phosphoglycerate dehydrogenase-like enzyme